MNNTYTSPTGTKYVFGYSKKLKYWTKRFKKALKVGDPKELQLALNKLNYFTAKHTNWLNAID